MKVCDLVTILEQLDPDDKCSVGNDNGADLTVYDKKGKAVADIYFSGEVTLSVSDYLRGRRDS